MSKIKVLFICHGNICRSPMAEFIFKQMIEEKNISEQYEVASAATSTEEIWNGIGNPVYPKAKAELAKHGICCDGKRARQITKEDYEVYDYLIGMDEMNMRNMERIFGRVDKSKMLLEYADIHRGVADPWYTGDFKKTYEDIVLGCKALIKIL